jgi:hypothetical protein
MREEDGVGVQPEAVTEPGVPGPPTSEDLAPGDRVVVSHSPAAVGPLIEGGNDPGGFKAA